MTQTAPTTASQPVARPVRKIIRSRQQRMLAGVSGGIAEYLGIDPTIVRLAFVATSFAGGAGIIAYVVGWLIIPEATA